MLAGCVEPMQDPTVTAVEFLGMNEYQNRNQIKELTGVDPVRTEWCAAFVNAILEMDGIPSLNDIDHPYPLTARGFLQWGMPVAKEDIQKGDLVIFPRGNSSWQGHVGFFIQEYNGQWIILGGNQDNTVSYKLFNPSRAIGIRRRTE